MPSPLNKYRVSLSQKDIETLMRVINHYVSIKGGADFLAETSLYKRLELVKIKIDMDMLKPEFTESAASVGKKAEESKLSLLQSKINVGTATEEEIKEFNSIQFGISL